MSTVPQRRLVSFIGIGGAGASSLLYSYIKSHPGVCVPEAETNYFRSVEAYKKGIDWYESFYAKRGSGLVCGELASSYIESAEAAALIVRTYPNAHLLAVVEDPLVSVRVAYVEARRSRVVDRETSLAMFLKQNPDVLARARYGRQLAQYFSYYAPIDLLVVTASDVRDDALRVIKETYQHIGVDESFVPLPLVYLVPLEDDPKMKPGLIKRTYRFIKKFIKSIFSRIINKLHPKKVPLETASVVAESIPLSPELEAYLKDYYRQDVALLSRLLHRSLTSEWGFDEEEPMAEKAHKKR
jgi:hypothetical protein